MGKVSPGYELMVVNHETGEPCAEGEMGELWIRGIRGISVFLEYSDNPEANDKMFTEDGWCRTGDVVRPRPTATSSTATATRTRSRSVARTSRPARSRTCAAPCRASTTSRWSRSPTRCSTWCRSRSSSRRPVAPSREAAGRRDHRGVPGEPGGLQGAPGGLLPRRVPDRRARQDLQEGPARPRRLAPRRQLIPSGTLRPLPPLAPDRSVRRPTRPAGLGGTRTAGGADATQSWAPAAADDSTSWSGWHQDRRWR